MLTARFRAASLAVAALAITAALPAHAQDLYLGNGDSYTADDATYQYNTIYVGQNDTFTLPANTVATLDVVAGGSVYDAYGNNTSTTNISGGNVFAAYGNNTSTTNISGGNVTNAVGLNTSTTNISGGTLTNGFLLSDPTATLNFVGTGLSFAYTGYGNSNSYRDYADFFKVTGTIGGVPNKSYNLYITNAAGAGGTPNSTARGFTFNGAAPVVVPEAGSLALVLPALALVGAVALRRKRIATA